MTGGIQLLYVRSTTFTNLTLSLQIKLVKLLYCNHLDSVRKIVLHILKIIFYCISVVNNNKSTLCTQKRKTFIIKWHNDSISNDASLLYMVQVRLFHFKTYIRDQKGSEKIARIVRSTLGFTYDELLENNNCNGI